MFIAIIKSYIQLFTTVRLFSLAHPLLITKQKHIPPQRRTRMNRPSMYVLRQILMDQHVSNLSFVELRDLLISNGTFEYMQVET